MRRRQIAQSELRWREWILAIAMVGGLPSVVSATHEADHRFTVEGFVCGTDGKGSANIDVLVKDTRISYGQIVKTDGDGYYKAAFHLHNDNLGDPLLVEARGEQREQKISFDPKDLEAERKVQVNFGTGCIQDREHVPMWVYGGLGAVAAAAGGFVGLKMIRSWRKQWQIERARYATALLKQGVSIFDTVYEAGYSDQPHLTRSLKHFIGSTPAEIPTTPIIALHHPA